MGGPDAKPYLQLRDLDLLFAKAKKPTERALGPEEFVFGLQELADVFYKKQWVHGRRALHAQVGKLKLSPGRGAATRRARSPTRRSHQPERPSTCPMIWSC